MLFVAAGAQAAIIYVDKDNACPGAGTAANPYCSIQNAFNTATAGDTIRIRDSLRPYDESATATTSGTSGNPIIVEPDVGHKPIFRYTGNGATAAVMHLSGVEYWTIRNLTFDGTGVFTSRFAIWVGGGGSRDTFGVQILGNTFRNWGGTEAQANDPSAPPAALIISGGWPGGTFLPNDTVVRGNLFDGNREVAIVMLSTKNSLVENNEIRSMTCGRNFDGWVNEIGIHIVSGSATAVGDVYRNNRIHDFAPHSTCRLANQGHAAWAGIWADTGPSDGVIEGNLIWNIDQNKSNPDNPLGLSHGSYGVFIEADCHGWIVRNNIIYKIGYAGLRNSPVNPGPVNQFLNNTVYQIGRWGMQFWYGYGVAKNNIFANAGLAQIHVDRQAVAQGNITIDYNLYSDTTGGTKVGEWAGAILNFAGWKTACNCDAHSLNTAPLFVNPPSGFQLQPSSPARGAGEGGLNIGASIVN